MSIHKRRDPVSRFAIAAMVASALACWSGGAFGADPKMPKELRGTWCAVGDTGGPKAIYRRCREAKGEQDFVADARASFNGEAACTPRSIVLDGNSYRIDMHCVFFIGEESSREEWRTSERWQLFTSGRRLEIRDAKALP